MLKLPMNGHPEFVILVTNLPLRRSKAPLCRLCRPYLLRHLAEAQRRKRQSINGRTLITNCTTSHARLINFTRLSVVRTQCMHTDTQTHTDTHTHTHTYIHNVCTHMCLTINQYISDMTVQDNPVPSEE